MVKADKNDTGLDDVSISRAILGEHAKDFSDSLESDVAIIGGMLLPGKRAAELSY